MAVTARFLADFTSFQQAVQAADVKLRSFESSTFQVGKSLSKMTDGFSGRKVIEEATMMNKLIGDTNSLALLTGNELQKAGAKAAEAIEKMKRLGIDVPPGLQRIVDQAKSAQGGFTGMLGSVNKLAGAFGVAFSVGAVVGFGKAVLADADALTKMADKTGVSVTGLQRLRIAGDDAGNTIDQMTTGINQMQNRLAGGDNSALKAFRDLGLSVDSIRSMAPDKQFIAIADAIRKVKDPADQVTLAMDVFGRSGAELLPVIKRGFDDVTDSGNVMSADAIKALDDAGDEIERLWRRTKAAIGETVGQAIALRGTFRPGMSQADRAEALGVSGEAASLAALNKQLDEMAKKVKPLQMAPSIPQILMPDKDADHAIRLMELEMDQLQRLNAEAKRAADEGFRQLLDRFDDLQLEVPKITGKVLDFNRSAAVLGQGFQSTMPKVVDGFSQLKTAIPVDTVRQLTDGFKQIGPVLPPINKHIRGFADALFDIKAGNFGAVFKDIAHFFKGGLGDIGKGFLRGIGENLLSGVTSLVTGGLTKLFHFFNKTEQKKVNDMRDQFVAMSGGIDALNKRAKDAGFTLDAFLKAGNVKAYTAEIERLTKAFEFQDAALSELADVEEKYHLSLNKTSSELFKSFQLLTGSGRDASQVVGAMKADWIALVVEARKFGIALPVSLKPILTMLGEMTDLTEEERAQLGDINDLRFDEVGTSGQTAFEKITQGVETMVAAVKAFLGFELTELEQRLLGLKQGIQEFSEFERFKGAGRGPDVPTALGGGPSAGVFESTNIINLDGQTIATNTTTHQLNARRNKYRSEAA